MSVSLNTAGAIVFKSSGAAAVDSYSMTLNAPTSVTAARSISMPDPGADCALQFGVKTVSTNKVAAYQCLMSDSGSIIKFSNAAANNITLPATATSAGFSVWVSQGTAQAAQTVQVICDGALLIGTIDRAGAASLTAAPSTNVNFLTAASQIGDMAYFVCNGSHWLVHGASSNAAGMSFT